MTRRETALGKLLQDSREAAGLSRLRTGELVGISRHTIEGWELGRVAKPPIHDILRLTHFLNIPADRVQQAVFQDAAVHPDSDQLEPRTRRPGRPNVRTNAAVPLLEAAYQLFQWKSDAAAAEALQTTPAQVRRWRNGTERMELSDYMTLTSMVAVAAASAINGDQAASVGLDAATHTLGLRPAAAKET